MKRLTQSWPFVYAPFDSTNRLCYGYHPFPEFVERIIGLCKQPERLDLDRFRYYTLRYLGMDPTHEGVGISALPGIATLQAQRSSSRGRTCSECRQHVTMHRISTQTLVSE